MNFYSSQYLLITIFAIISSSTSLQDEKIIYFPIILNFNAYFTNAYCGLPSQKILLSLDQELQVTWTDTIHYKILNSRTAKEINQTKISFRKINLFGNTISDKILFINDKNSVNNISKTENITIDDFWFVTIENSRGYDSRVGGIGLTYKFLYEEYSLIHQFKKNNLINYLSYGFIPPSLFNKNNSNSNNSNDTKNNEGLIFFGGIPKDYINNKFRYNCKVTEKYNFWSCDLPYILFGKISYNSNINNTLFFENNNYAYFNGAERRSLAPEDFTLFLKHNYFKDAINNRTCEYHLIGMNYVFECVCNIKSNFPDITFIFDNYQYKFTSEELFEYYGVGNCLFLIQSNHLRNNNFVFGSSFLNKFISNFDYETKYITFYSENQINKIDLNKFRNLTRINLNIIGIIIFLLIVCVIFYIRKKIKNMKLKKDALLDENNDKNKIKKMNKEEEGYELN